MPPKSRRQVKAKAASGWHVKSRTSKNPPRTLNLHSIRSARARGRPLLVDLRVLASAYPNEKVPMLVVDDIRTAKRHISTGLVIDTSVLRKLIPDLAHKSPITTQNQLLGTDDMLDLEQVIDVLGTAGRSTVHAMEAGNRIFGLLPPGRLRGKRYPRWQFDRALAGEPLRRVLSELESIDAWGKYQFFSSVYPELGELTPVEVLTSSVERPVAMTDETRALISAPHEKRLALIVELAKEFAHPS